MRLVLVAGLLAWVGVTLALSSLRWFSRPPLAERLRPYSPRAGTPRRPRLLSATSFQELVGPLAGRIGERASRLFGVTEELSLRLERIHAPLDVTGFRVRQVGAAVVGLAVAGGVLVVAHPAPVVALAGLVAAPLLIFLVIEQRSAARSADWQRRTRLELPVVAEQLALLLSAGYSLGMALNRLAQRGEGAIAQDLRRVMARVRQGLTEIEACREWAAIVRVDAVDRLLPVLALNTEATDLGRLLSEEARAIRRDVQRELVETMERRSQSVWIPVTVATLIPGVILLAIPFSEALRLFTSG